jgi:hypothetical protein
MFTLALGEAGGVVLANSFPIRNGAHHRGRRPGGRRPNARKAEIKQGRQDRIAAPSPVRAPEPIDVRPGLIVYEKKLRSASGACKNAQRG